MAPGLNGRQAGTVPKNKPKNSGSQLHRLEREQFNHSSAVDWEHMPNCGNKNLGRNRRSTTHSEAEADCIRYDLDESKSSHMSSQNDSGEGCSQDSFSSKINLPDRKRVVCKLSEIQNYVQQTTALMNSLKTSDSPAHRVQYDKLAVMLEDLKDSEGKLSSLLNKMDNTGSRIDLLLSDLEENQGSDSLQTCIEVGNSRRMQKFNRIVNENYGPIMCVSNAGNNSVEADEEELARRSEESKKKLEALQKRKQDLLQLQENAKKQLQEAQAEQFRLVARASRLNQELNANKVMDLNVQQLNQRLKAVQQIYNTRNQISEVLAENPESKRNEVEQADEDQRETSDTEPDLQLVADKMEELNAMKAQLSQIQKLMATISGMNGAETVTRPGESVDDDVKEPTPRNTQNSSCIDGDQVREEANKNIMELEQTNSKLNQLTQLLEIMQSSNNITGLSPYLQAMSNLMNDETRSSVHSASPVGSIKCQQRNGEDIAVDAMQVMARELEETASAMKGERDRLVAARQELQEMARKLPLTKPEGESVSPEDDSGSEPPTLKPAALDFSARETLNESEITETEPPSNCNEDSPYLCRVAPPRSKQRGTWNSLLVSNSTSQEKRRKNGSFSRSSNQSSRGGSRSAGRDQSRWSPSPSVSYCNERSNPIVQTQNQLDMSGNLCEMMLSEALHRGRPVDISLEEMFSQHQLLTKTVAQCSQLLWLQQKQITELRNAFMLQSAAFPNLQFQQIVPNQSNAPVINSTPYSGLLNRPLFSQLNQVPPMAIQQHQNYQPSNQGVKLNTGDIQNVQIPHQDFMDQFSPQGNQNALTFTSPELFGCDMRFGNFNRFNASNANANQSVNQNISSGSNNRVPNGMNCLGPEDSRALNNQVPPGNRANNYWDNFRSYSRQNLLSNTKSNEETDFSRRSLATSSLERLPRDAFVPAQPQNNQFTASLAQQSVLNHGNSDSSASDQYLLPPSQNTRANHQNQTMRSRSVEPQNHRNPGKNESRHQDNDSRNFNVSGKNEGSGGARARIPESRSENIRSVRNDVNQSLRNSDNINSSRNFEQLVRVFENEEAAQGNNKKRLERTRCRNVCPGNLNNRGYHNTSLWENIYSEVSNFIRTNEAKPHFLAQLFRDLQQVTTDNLRHRTLESIQETVASNNLTERTTNGGGNVNLIENRNNIRESRSNLNRNQADDPNGIDELFYHLRENQNTIRQNIGMSSSVLGGNNLENPNISNLRDLGNPRNNLESEGLRDLRTYFEANLCNFGHNSTLENPNLSNIRENLTRRGPVVSDFENANPKNVYLSIHDNAVLEMRRRNQEASALPDFDSPFRNFEEGNAFIVNNEPSVQASHNQYEVGNNFEEVGIGDRAHFQHENRPTASRFPILEGGDNFGASGQFLASANDSGIDINFNNDERKGGFVNEGAAVSCNIIKAKKNGGGEVEGVTAFILPQWERSRASETSFDSSLSLSRNEISSSFMPVCENSFFNSRNFQQSDNGDLAEADQSRNEETSGAESDTGYMNGQTIESETVYALDQNLQGSDIKFSSQNIPESERSFMESQSVKSEGDLDGAAGINAAGVTGFVNSTSEPEGNFSRENGGSESIQKNESAENFYYQLIASSSSESCAPKSGKHRKKTEDTAEREGDVKKTSCKNSTNKFRDISFGKFNGNEDQKAESESMACVVDGRQRPEGRDSLYYGDFQLDNGMEGEKANTSPEAESDWECGCGLDQVPTRLDKNGSSRKSEDSSGPVP